MAIKIELLVSEAAGAPSSLARIAGQAIGEHWVLAAAAWTVNARGVLSCPVGDQVEDPQAVQRGKRRS